MLCLTGTFLICVFVFFVRGPCLARRTRHFLLNSTPTATKGVSARRWLIVFLAFLIVLAYLILVWPAFISSHGVPSPWWVLGGVALLPVLAIFQTSAAIRKQKHPERTSIVMLGIALVWAAVVALLLAREVPLPPLAGSSTLIALVRRYMRPESGLSFMLPLMLWCFGLMWWTWQNIQGAALCDARMPCLPTSAQGLPDQFIGISGDNNPVDDTMKLGSWLLRFVFLFIPVTLVLYFIIEPHRLMTLEPQEWSGWPTIFLFLVTVAFATESLYRFLLVWARTRALLRSLESQPFRRALSRIEGFSWRSIWKIGAGLATSAYRLLTRQIEALALLRSMCERNGYTEIRNELVVRRAWKGMGLLRENREGAATFADGHAGKPGGAART